MKDASAIRNFNANTTLHPNIFATPQINLQCPNNLALSRVHSPYPNNLAPPQENPSPSLILVNKLPDKPPEYSFLYNARNVV